MRFSSKLKVGLKIAGCIFLVLSLCGFKLRNFLVPMIVNSAEKRLSHRPAYEARWLAEFYRDGKKEREVEYQILSTPPYTYLYEVVKPQKYENLSILSSEKEFIIYDPQKNQAEIIRNIPQFSIEEFRKYMKFITKRSLRNYSIKVGFFDYLFGKDVTIKSLPKENNILRVISHAKMDRKSQVFIGYEDYDVQKRLLSKYKATSINYDIKPDEKIFKIDFKKDCKFWIWDLKETKDISECKIKPPEYLPKTYETLELQRMKYTKDSKKAIYDYSCKGIIFILFEQPAKDPMLINPIHREFKIRNEVGYCSFAGEYMIFKWRENQKEWMVLTNLNVLEIIEFANLMEL